MRTRTNTATRVAAGVAVTMLAALGVELTHPGHTAPRVEIITPASSATPAVDAELAEVDRIPAASTTPDTVAPPATVPTPAPPAPLPAATIDAAPLVVTRTEGPQPYTPPNGDGPQPYAPPVMHRTQDGTGYCYGAGAADLPASDAADPTCPQPTPPAPQAVPEATPEQIAAPLAPLYPTVPGYAPAPTHDGSSSANYPKCWTGCTPGIVAP